MGSNRIFLSVPHMGELELEMVKEAFASNWLSSVGPHIDAFEKEFGERVGGHACAVSSGTAALHIGLRLLGVSEGDVVIAPSFTFIASINPILYLGAKPVFVDSEPRTWGADPALVEHAIRDLLARGKRPKAVIAVHLYGNTVDLAPLQAVCAQYDVPLLEDAAEALGTQYRGEQVGQFGAVNAFSFNGNKIITTTGGGMVVSPREDFIRRARHWATQARDPGIAYEHTEYGYNYRMSNVLAGIGRGQLQVLDNRVASRRAVAARYRDAFRRDVPELVEMPETESSLHTRWLSCFTFTGANAPAIRDRVIAVLAENDIESRPLWKPMHLQPLFRTMFAAGTSTMHDGSVCEDLFARGICLPSSSSLPESDQARVIELVHRTVQSQRGAAA